MGFSQSIAVVSLVTWLSLTPIFSAEKVQPDFTAASVVLSGWLKIGITDSAVVRTLGAAGTKDIAVLEGATGLYIQHWVYPKQGVTLEMSADSAYGRGRVSAITLVAPCSLTTVQHIGIGSSESDVLQAYKGTIDKNNARTSQKIVVGTMYDGMIFSVNNGMVARIFIGSASY